MRDRGDPHRHVEFLERDMAVRFAERPFGLEQRRIDEAFDHDLRFGGHHEVDRFRAHHLRSARPRARPRRRLRPRRSGASAAPRKRRKAAQPSAIAHGISLSPRAWCFR